MRFRLAPMGVTFQADSFVHCYPNQALGL